jgi:hypothetical protein
MRTFGFLANLPAERRKQTNFAFRECAGYAWLWKQRAIGYCALAGMIAEIVLLGVGSESSFDSREASKN